MFLILVFCIGYIYTIPNPGFIKALYAKYTNCTKIIKIENYVDGIECTHFATDRDYNVKCERGMLILREFKKMHLTNHTYKCSDLLNAVEFEQTNKCFESKDYDYMYSGCEGSPYSCQGKYFFDLNLCSKHGNCLTNGTCNCHSGWEGNQCQHLIHYCGGKKYSDKKVCGGSDHGTCDSSNCIWKKDHKSCYCRCYVGWTNYDWVGIYNRGGCYEVNSNDLITSIVIFIVCFMFSISAAAYLLGIVTWAFTNLTCNCIHDDDYDNNCCVRCYNCCDDGCISCRDNCCIPLRKFLNEGSKYMKKYRPPMKVDELKQQYQQL